MRILYVLTDAKIGGAETLVETLAANKDSEDTVGLLVLLGPDELSPRLEQAFDFVEYLDVGEESRNIVKMVRGLEALVKRFKPSVIHSNLFHADLVTLLARTGGVPKVTTIHTQGFGPRDHPLTKLIARAVGIGSFRFSSVIPIGPTSHKFAQSLGYKGLVDSISNSANVSRTSLFDVTNTCFVSIGRFHPVKGHAILLEAYSRVRKNHPHWSLICTGPGVDPSNEELIQLVHSVGLDSALRSGALILAGSTHDVGGVLSRSTALIISSLYGETFPMVGVEATGAGIPVITTNVGESRVFAFDESYVVRPGDSDELAAAMIKFISLTSEEKLTASEGLRRRALRDFNPRDLVAKYRTVYSEVISRSTD